MHVQIYEEQSPIPIELEKHKLKKNTHRNYETQVFLFSWSTWPVVQFAGLSDDDSARAVAVTYQYGDFSNASAMTLDI